MESVSAEVCSRAVRGVAGTLSRDVGEEGDGERGREGVSEGHEMFCPRAGAAVGGGCTRMAREEGDVLLRHLRDKGLDGGEVDDVQCRWRRMSSGSRGRGDRYLGRGMSGGE